MIPPSLRPLAWHAARPIAPLVGALLVGALLVGGCLLGGCEAVSAPTDDRLTFAEMQALNPGVAATWILVEHPFARDVDRDPRTGRVRRLSYWVEDPAGRPRPLVLHFDERGILARKDYGGPIIRPPENSAPALGG